jgi:hypothetical protein
MAAVGKPYASPLRLFYGEPIVNSQNTCPQQLATNVNPITPNWSANCYKPLHQSHIRRQDHIFVMKTNLQPPALTLALGISAAILALIVVARSTEAAAPVFALRDPMALSLMVAAVIFWLGRARKTPFSPSVVARYSFHQEKEMRARYLFHQENSSGRRYFPSQKPRETSFAPDYAGSSSAPWSNRRFFGDNKGMKSGFLYIAGRNTPIKGKLR